MLTIHFIHLRNGNAVQRILAGMYSMAGEQILMAKIYNAWYFIEDQPGADRIDSALVAGVKQHADNGKQQDRSPYLKR